MKIQIKLFTNNHKKIFNQSKMTTARDIAIEEIDNRLKELTSLYEPSTISYDFEETKYESKPHLFKIYINSDTVSISEWYEFKEYTDNNFKRIINEFILRVNNEDYADHIKDVNEFFKKLKPKDEPPTIPPPKPPSDNGDHLTKLFESVPPIPTLRPTYIPQYPLYRPIYHPYTRTETLDFLKQIDELVKDNK